MGRKPLDIEDIALDLIMNDDMAAKKKLAKKYGISLIKKAFIPPASMNFIWPGAGVNSAVSPFPPLI